MQANGMPGYTTNDMKGYHEYINLKFDEYVHGHPRVDIQLSSKLTYSVLYIVYWICIHVTGSIRGVCSALFVWANGFIAV